MTHPIDDPYLRGPVPRTSLRTALPIVMLTSLNGLFAVVDAALVGLWVGPEALAAVTLVFPLSMLLAALATAVGSGAATLMGQRLGAGRAQEARQLLRGARGLAIALSAGAAVLFALGGWAAVLRLSGGSEAVAGMGWTFLGVSVAGAPVALLLAVQGDALRAEGQVGAMAGVGLVAALANVGLNALLVAGLGLGVAGSALGTVLAQALALGLGLRLGRRGPIGQAPAPRGGWGASWGPILALGAPRSLSFLGVALGAGAVLTALRLHGGSEATVAAYGIATRLLTFAYLPLLGLALALQAMVSHSHGAGRPTRSAETLRLALWVALAYSAVVQAALTLGRWHLGGLFTGDVAVAAELARILPVTVALYVVFGPCLMVANHLQALGEARRALLLSVVRTYAFAAPLTFLLPIWWGEAGIWLAAPAADALLLAVTLTVAWRPGRRAPASSL